MDSSGVASACNQRHEVPDPHLDGLQCVCVCAVCVSMHEYVSLRVHAGCMCPCVRGPWHLLMKKSSQRVLPRSQAALLPQESFSPVCHIGWWSPLNAQSLIRNMLLSVFVCLCVCLWRGHTHSLSSKSSLHVSFSLLIFLLYVFPMVGGYWCIDYLVGWLDGGCLIVCQTNTVYLLPSSDSAHNVQN